MFLGLLATRRYKWCISSVMWDDHESLLTRNPATPRADLLVSLEDTTKLPSSPALNSGPKRGPSLPESRRTK